MTRAQKSSFDKDTLQTRIRKQLGFVSFKCIPQLRELARISAELFSSHCANFPTPTTVQHHYSCPMGHPKLATFPFDPHNAAKPVWCSTCSKPYVGAKWVCSCHRVWSTCAIHFPLASDTTPRHLGKRKPPRAFSEHEAATKFRRLEPVMRRDIIGPRLAARFPHLISSTGGTQSAHINQTLRIFNADAVGCSCIAADDPVGTRVAQSSGSSSSSDVTLGLQSREGSNTDNAAELADAVTPLAAAVAAAEAPAAPVIVKRKSKPFRIP